MSKFNSLILVKTVSFDTQDKKSMNLNYLFSQELQHEMVENSKILTLKKDDILVHEGDHMKYLPFLKSGLIKVYKEDLDLDRELLLYYVESGQTCMMSLVASLKDQRSKVNAKIENDSEVILIPIDKVILWQKKYEEWNQWILDIFLERYSEVMDTINEITFNKIEDRVRNYLRKLSHQNNSQMIEATHLSIANDLGTTRVVISRILKKIENDDLVKLLRGKIILKKLYLRNDLQKKS